MVEIVAIGDNDVDCYVSTGQMYPGGNCFNVATYTRRFGARSAYVGAVADDPAGRLIRDTLIAEDVDTSHLRMATGLTAYCVIGHQGAERIFLANDLGVSRFVPTDEDIGFLADHDAAHVGQSSGLDDWLKRIAGQTRLSYDFSVHRDRAHLEAISPLCWLASFSAGDLTAEQTSDLMKTISDAGAQWVLATLGSKGAMLTDGRAKFVVDAPAISPIDTLGAGDTFIARTMVGLLQGDAPQKTLQAAGAEAARTCGYYGAVGYGIPIDLPVSVPELAQVSG